jgi:cob(I)alamin adenosyltransferase
VREYERELPAAGGFVTPGDCPGSIKLDLARTVCRRAERRLAALDRQGDLPEGVLPYINRLSDLLFLLARVEEGAVNN